MKRAVQAVNSEVREHAMPKEEIASCTRCTDQHGTDLLQNVLKNKDCETVKIGFVVKLYVREIAD